MTLVRSSAVSGGAVWRVGTPAVSDPDPFTIDRVDAGEHLGFGHGVHSCADQGLARMRNDRPVVCRMSRTPGHRRFGTSGRSI